jgi:hypothetical protein
MSTDIEVITLLVGKDEKASVHTLRLPKFENSTVAWYYCENTAPQRQGEVIALMLEDGWAVSHFVPSQETLWFTREGVLFTG